MYKLKVLSISIILVMLLSLAGPSLDVAAAPLYATSPTLGAAASFSVLAKTTITDADLLDLTSISGDVGLDNFGASYAGLTTVEVAGTIYATDAAGPDGALGNNPVLMTNARNANIAAYGQLNAGANADANCIAPYVFGAGVVDLVGANLVPGVYCADAFTLSGTLTLSGSGVWVFKSAATLITSGTANVVGGDPCNVWWRVVSSATLGTNTSLIGNILALTSIGLDTGATLYGRALAQNAAVTLDRNTISGPPCNTTTATALSTGSITAGGTAFDAATLTGDNSAIAAGTVTYNVYSDAGCTALTQTSGPFAVVAGALPNSGVLTFPAVGTYYWRATYNPVGDPYNKTSTSACGAEVLTVTAPPPPPPIPGAPGSVPGTGFAPQRVTVLSTQPAQKAYADLGDLWLEIPRLGVQMPIVGVPQTDGEWDVSWLGNQAGWLNGSAFPTWNGNSVITGHVWNADNTAGPFAAVNQLWWGDKVIVHAWGGKYVYEVRTVMQVSPTNTAAMMKHQELPWITLVTCRGYDAASNSYKYRVLVRAVLVEVN